MRQRDSETVDYPKHPVNVTLIPEKNGTFTAHGLIFDQKQSDGTVARYNYTAPYKEGMFEELGTVQSDGSFALKQPLSAQYLSSFSIINKKSLV